MTTHLLCLRLLSNNWREIMGIYDNLTKEKLREAVANSNAMGEKYLPILTGYARQLEINDAQSINDGKNDFLLHLKNVYVNFFYRVVSSTLNSLDLSPLFDSIKTNLVNEVENNRSYLSFKDGYLYDGLVDLNDISYEFVGLSEYILEMSKSMIGHIKSYNLSVFLDTVSESIHSIFDSYDIKNDRISSQMYLELMLLGRIYDTFQNTIQYGV